MAVINRSAHPDLLWPGVHKVFGMSYEKTPELWREIFDERTSQKHMEIMAESTFFGLASVKGESQSVTFDEARQGTRSTFSHLTYGHGYIQTREEIEDNQYRETGEARSRALANSMKETKEIVAANVLNRAGTSGYTGGDGVTLLSTAHPTRSGNQANRLAVDADISEAAIEDCLKLIFNAKNARGLAIKINPRMLIVSNNEIFNAQRYVNSALRSGTANNDLNALKEMDVFPDGIMRYRYLTDDDAWFITTDCPDGMVMFTRRKVEFDKDEDFGTENARAKSTMRFSVGWGDWRGIFGSVGA